MKPAKISLTVLVTKETRWPFRIFNNYREIFFVLDVKRPEPENSIQSPPTMPLVFKFLGSRGWVGIMDLGQFKRTHAAYRQFNVPIVIEDGINNWYKTLSDVVGCASFRNESLEGASGIARLMGLDNWDDMDDLDDFVPQHLEPVKPYPAV